MTMLMVGIIIFFGVHLIPILTLKERLINKWGKLPYIGLFSVMAGIGLALLIYGKGYAPFVEIWQPMIGSHWVPVILMLPASILISWAHVPSNMKDKLQHPMLMGVTLFSVAHLFANGDLASILLFGSFLIYSVLTMFRLSKKLNSIDAKPKSTNFKMNRWDSMAMVAGSLVYVLVFLYHIKITGVAIQLTPILQ